MDKLQAMQVFTRVVESKSFTGAAASMDMTRSTATTIVQKLEAHLKVRLLNRTTRSVSLTPDGAAYYERCLRVLADIDEAENSFSSLAAPKGKLRVEMSGAIGRLVVLPALDDFYEKYPEIDLLLGIGDKAADLVQEGVDCAIRMGSLTDSTLVAKRIGVSEFVTTASPEYLEQHGTPRSLDDLADHFAVHYVSSRRGRMVDMAFRVDGDAVDVRMRSRLASNDGEAYLQCGLRGHGLIQTFKFLAQPHIESGALVEVLEPWRPAPLPISAVYPQNRHLSPQVRVFVDWISDLFEKSHMLKRELPALIGVDITRPLKLPARS